MYGNSQNTEPPAPRHAQPPAPQPYHLHHDFTGSAALTATLAHALSDLTGADVTDVEAQLAECVDPSALDGLFRAGAGKPRSSGHVGLTVWDHQVTLYNDGHIVITPPPQPPNPQHPRSDF